MVFFPFLVPEMSDPDDAFRAAFVLKENADYRLMPERASLMPGDEYEVNLGTLHSIHGRAVGRTPNRF